jgi:hypothetical protein
MACADYVLSSHEFDVLWHELELGAMPYPLAVPRTGRTPEQRAQFADEVYRELGDRGIVSGRLVDAGLERLLRLLGCYRRSIDVVADIGYPVRALAAADQGAGVLAVLAGGELWLTGIEVTALAAAIVGVLPAAAPGPSGPIDPAERSGGDLAREGELLAEAGAAVLAGLAANRRAGGRFGISVCGARGLTLLNWLDTEQGRYLLMHKDSWLSVGPADAVGIERRLAAILSEAAGA